MLYADGKVITPLFKGRGDDPCSTRPPVNYGSPATNPTGTSTSKATARPRSGSSSSSSPSAAPRIAAGSSSTPNGSPTPAAKPPPPWTASPASPRSLPAPKASSTTPPCAACTTRPCSATSACSRSTASPPPKPEPRSRDEATASVNRRAPTSKTRRSHCPTAASEPCVSTPATAPSGSANSPTPATSPSPNYAATRTHRNADKSGRYRWYNDYRLPQRHGGGTLTVRLHGNDDDRARKLNRTENLRPIPPGDPDFARLYPRRNDAESINRDLDDTLYLRRAHSRRPRPPAPQPARLRPHRQRDRRPPPHPTPRTRHPSGLNHTPACSVSVDTVACRASCRAGGRNRA